MKHIIVNLDGVSEVDMTPEEIAKIDAINVEANEIRDAHFAKTAEKEDLKASAKAKLIAGEALTEDEANTIVL